MHISDKKIGLNNYDHFANFQKHRLQLEQPTWTIS